MPNIKDLKNIRNPYMWLALYLGLLIIVFKSGETLGAALYRLGF